MWGARNSKPLTSFGTNQCARMMAAPGPRALKFALHVLHYMYGTMDEGIVFRSDGNEHVTTYYDASFKPNPQNGKCPFGYTSHLYGGPVSWLSKTLPHVGTHVGQNEQAAHCFAAKHAIYLKYLHEEMLVREEPLAVLLGDNDSATLFAQEDMVTSGNKYIYLPYFYSKEVEDVLTVSERVPTANNNADIMTKGVDAPTIEYLGPRLCGYTGHDGKLFEFDVKRATYIPP